MAAGQDSEAIIATLEEAKAKLGEAQRHTFAGLTRLGKIRSAIEFTLGRLGRGNPAITLLRDAEKSIKDRAIEINGLSARVDKAIAEIRAAAGGSSSVPSSGPASSGAAPVSRLPTSDVVTDETPVLVHNYGGAADATEIVTKKADQYHDSQAEARGAALRAHGVSDESFVETRTMYGKDSPNLRGPKGEPYEQLDAINDNGEVVTIDHHSSGHYFADNNTFARPHYHGPAGEHFFYGERIW